MKTKQSQAMDSLLELEALQARILRRIESLELAVVDQRISNLSISSCHRRGNDRGTGGCGGDGDGDGEELDTVSRLSAILRASGVKDFVFKRVVSDYYSRTFEERRDMIGAASIDHLCKSIVMVNTQAPANVTDCSDRNYSKYYVVVVQYIARLNAESIKNFLYQLNDCKIPKKKFNMRLAPEEESQKLTGFVHNAVTCIGMQTDIPVILDEAITKLEPDFFWLGGGEVELKLGVRTSQFIAAVNPFVVSCSSN